MIKRALICGVNYVGSQYELRGCINDAHTMHRLVLDKLGFTQTKLLLEDAATTDGILDGLRWLVKDVVPGDVILFHFSGHGSQVRSNIEPDGLDEIICPIDINWRDKVIKDDHLKEIFDAVPNGVNITVILDCCHSGSGLDNDAEVQRVANLPVIEPNEDGRFLPMPAEVQSYIDAEGLELRDFKTSRDVNRSALLIAGCMPHQTSADAFIDGKFQGAATYALVTALENGKTTYRELVDDMNRYMVEEEFEQRPQLDGHPSLYDQLFLQPWGTAPDQVAVVPPPGTWGVQPPAVEPPKKEDSGIVVTLLVALLAAAITYLFFA